MKKILAILSLALLFAGCAPSAKSASNFKQVYPLKGKTVLVATAAHKNYTDFANDVTNKVSSDIGARGVNTAVYYQSDNSLELSENPVVDKAKEVKAEFILSQTFTTLSIYNAALEKFEEEISLFSIADKKVVWKGSISWSNPMPMGLSAGVTGASDEVVRLLVQDGFVPAQ